MTLSTHTRRQLSYAEGYLALGMKAEAAKALAEIEKVEQEAVPVLKLRLALEMERGKWMRASVAGSKLAELEPDVAEHWIQWAYAVRRYIGIDEARAILVRGLGLHPTVAVFHFNLACYEAQLGHLDDARLFLDTACGLDPVFVELAKTDADLAPLRA